MPFSATYARITSFEPSKIGKIRKSRNAFASGCRFMNASPPRIWNARFSAYQPRSEASTFVIALSSEKSATPRSTSPVVR